MQRVIGGTVDEGDYPGLPSLLNLFIQTFRNSLGDITIYKREIKDFEVQIN